MREPGYWEAVENLAWEVRRVADKDFGELELTGEDKIDFEMMYLKSKVGECQDQWSQLDDIFYTIAEEYDIPIDEVLSEVWTTILKQDLHERGWIT